MIIKPCLSLEANLKVFQWKIEREYDYYQYVEERKNKMHLVLQQHASFSIQNTEEKNALYFKQLSSALWSI